MKRTPLPSQSSRLGWRRCAHLSLGLLLAAALFTGTARGEDNAALVRILVRKGILTEKEAAEVQAELAADKATEQAETSASKLKISDSVTELKLGGDTRIRYETGNRDRQVDPAQNLPPPPPGTAKRSREEDRSPSGEPASRWRFRLRLAADFKFAGGFFGGVSLETNQASDSANQTFQDGFDDYGIFISRAFLGWNSTDWLTVIIGKQTNPFYSTDLVWDPDINPTGLVETVRFHKMFSSKAGTSGLAKDGKTLIASKPTESPWEITANLGQFIFDDNDENAEDNDASEDPYLLVGQLVIRYNFNKNTKATFAPGYMTYINGDVTGLRNNNAFTDTEVSGETRNLSILTAPGDLSFKVAGLKTRLYWDFAYNLEGEDRATDIYAIDYNAADSIAWLAGVQFGDGKKSGDWTLAANFRQTGIASVDPNLNDSDFAFGELNTQGYRIAVTYNLTNWLLGAVTYSHAWNLREDLAGGQATGGAAIADTNSFDLLQFDLNWKF